MASKWKQFTHYLSKPDTCSPSIHQSLIENSVYIVPPRNLLSYQYINGISLPVQDQTVWVIDKYDRGYFFGKEYTALNTKPSTERNLVGSITPNGSVYITFFTITNTTSSTPVRGIGSFTLVTDCKTRGYFTMQMDSAQNATTGLAHWAYMIPVKPTDFLMYVPAGTYIKKYRYLPGLDISVPDFIKMFN